MAETDQPEDLVIAFAPQPGAQIGLDSPQFAERADLNGTDSLEEIGTQNAWRGGLFTVLHPRVDIKERPGKDWKLIAGGDKGIGSASQKEARHLDGVNPAGIDGVAQGKACSRLDIAGSITTAENHL